MNALERIRRIARDLETQIRALPLHATASRRPVLPGRAPNVDLDTRHLWNCYGRLRQALTDYEQETDNRRTDMPKPLNFGVVYKTADEGRPCFQELANWGVLKKSYEPAPGALCQAIVWTAQVDCAINETWLAPGDVIVWEVNK
jgi:hypothetical protein